MSLYEKKFVYFDYFEDDNKIGNAGFAKLILQGEQCRLSVNVSGLHKTDTKKCELLLLDDEREIQLDHVLMQQGGCSYSCLFTKEDMNRKDIQFEKVYGLCIKISEQRLLKAVWRKEKPESSEEPEGIPETGTMPEQEEPPEAQAIPELQVMAMPEAEPVTEAEVIAEPEPAEKPELQAKPEGGQEPMPENLPPVYTQIRDDKWQQLEQIFPMIHPFGDEKQYLSVAPKDFVVLTRQYQPLANNSFLLHGFYNYHHIILGKIPRGGQEQFYLGVPGVFYEREKAVAIMFGFESFECAKEPAETGTFGYYMKRVEI